MFTLAHITDPHLGPLPAVQPRDLMNKRILGFLSWTRRRHKIHRPEVLTALAADLRDQRPDHLAITGDITNISLPGEFSGALRWLESLGSPRDVSVIPGNHDAYIAVPWETSLGLWRDYMASHDDEGQARPPEGPGDFPFVRRLGEIALIGLSSAEPSPPAFATGRLGADQLSRLADLLGLLGQERLFRVVLVHHPPDPAATKARKRLIDGAELMAVIGREGAELILHGHEHSFATEEIARPQGPVPVFGIPSASAAKGTQRHPVAHYQTYEIARRENGWRIGVSLRGYNPQSGEFEAVRQHQKEIATG